MCHHAGNIAAEFGQLMDVTTVIVVDVSLHFIMMQITAQQF
jgi:hypothetical protein